MGIDYEIIKGIKEGLSLGNNILTVTGTKDGIADGANSAKQELSRLRTKYCSKNEITDSWEEIFSSIDNNTYKKKYKIGDYKLCDFGKEGNVYMQIAAFDMDEMDYKKGKAAITWIGMYCLKTKREINESGFWLPTITNKGGWEKSDLRLTMNVDIFSLISEKVSKRIVNVKKVNEQGYTSDKLWLLSVDEYKKYGLEENIYFTGNSSFWLRDSIGKSKFYMISSHGGLMKILSNVKDGVLVCFCTN